MSKVHHTFYLETCSAPGRENFSGKFLGEFEYLYWFLETSPLLAFRNYSEDYLRFLRSEFRLSATIAKKEGQLRNYWFWESQLDPALFRRDHLLEAMSPLMNRAFSTDASLFDTYPAYLKRPFSSSGRGIKLISSREHLISIPKGGLLEEKLEREADFSCLVNGSEEFWYRSLIAKNLSYGGANFQKKNYQQREEFLKELALDEAQLKDFVQKLQQLLIRLHQAGLFHFNLDFFTFSRREELGIALAEINFRKTMGYFFTQIFQKLDAEQADFIIERNRKAGELYISPSTNDFQISVKLS